MELKRILKIKKKKKKEAMSGGKREL